MSDWTTAREHADELRRADEHREVLMADIVQLRRIVHNECSVRDILEARRDAVFKYIDGCAVLRTEPNKHTIRKLLEGVAV